MKRAWLVVVAALWCIGTVFAQGTPGTGEAAKAAALPEGVVGVVEFHNLDAIEDHLAAFAKSASPETPRFAAIGTMLGTMAKTLNPGLLDSAHPVRILLVKVGGAGGQAGERTIAPVLQFTVKDMTAYRASLFPALQKVEEKEGVTTYTQENREFDREAFQKATAEERKNFQRFMKTTQSPVAIGAADSAFCIGGSLPAVRQILALVRQGAIGDTPLLQGGDVAAQVELAAMLNHLAQGRASAFAGLKEGLKGMLAMAQAMGQGAQTAEMTQRILGIEIDALESLCGQVERGSARLDFDAQDIRLSLNVAPVRGGKLAGYLASVQPGAPDALLKYLLDNSFAVAALKVGDFGPLAGPFEAFMSKAFAAMGVSPADSAPFSKACIEMFLAQGDQCSFAISPGGGMRVVQAIRLKDAAAFQAARQKVAQSMKPFLEAYRGMGISMQFQTEATAYNGHEITRWKLPLDTKPPAGATPEQAAAAAAQQKMMKAMYGDALTVDSVVLDKDFVLTMGADSLETLKQIIAGKQKKIADSQSFKQALAILPPQATGFALVHITGLMDWSFSQARAARQTAGNMPLMLPDMKFKPGPGATVICLNGPEGSLNCDLRVPAAEVKAVADGFKAAMKNANPPGGPQPRRAPVKPAPPAQQ